MVEFLTGVMFVLVALRVTSLATLESGFHVGDIFHLFFYLFMTSCFIIIFFEDLLYGVIPDIVVYSGVLAWIVYLLLAALFSANLSFVNNSMAAVGSFLFFLGLYLVTRGGGMGFGDVKFSALMGLFLGFPNIVIALYFSFLIGGLVGLFLVTSKMRSMKQTIPFGPFLVIGLLLTFFFGSSFYPLLGMIFRL